MRLLSFDCREIKFKISNERTAENKENNFKIHNFKFFPTRGHTISESKYFESYIQNSKRSNIPKK